MFLGSVAENSRPMVTGIVRSTTTVRIALLPLMALSACIGAPGPSFDAEPDTAFSCQAPLAQDEAVLVKGERCLDEFLSPSDDTYQVLSSSEVRSMALPSAISVVAKYKADQKEAHSLTSDFVNKPNNIDGIKEYNVRFLVFSTSASYEEPFESGWRWEDVPDAIYHSREKWSEISAVVVDSRDGQIVGYINQRSEGQIVLVPLLITQSIPDTHKSACQEVALALSQFFSGDCATLNSVK